MKKIKLFLYVLSFLSILSCDKDDDDAITLNLIGAWKMTEQHTTLSFVKIYDNPDTPEETQSDVLNSTASSVVVTFTDDNKYASVGELSINHVSTLTIEGSTTEDVEEFDYELDYSTVHGDWELNGDQLALNVPEEDLLPGFGQPEPVTIDEFTENSFVTTNEGTQSQPEDGYTLIITIKEVTTYVRQ